MSDCVEIALTQGQVALIDAADLTLVSQYRWHASWNPHMRGYYASTSVKRADGRSTTLYMHRLITAAPKGTEVDHLNHRTLDNRRSNLRVGTHKDNMQNCRFAQATHCPAGHPYDDANTGYSGRGKTKRYCRACARERVRAVYEAETPEERERRRATVKAYYESNKAILDEKNRQYAAAHKAEKREYDKRRREAARA